MNKIYKVMYSKVKQCCVVVSEIAKSHGRHTKRSVAKSSAALTAGVLIALGSFSFEGMPVVQAADGTESLKNNDYVGANGYYWYFDEKTNQWTKYPYKISSLNNNRSWQELPNYEGGGAKEPGAVTAGLYAQAGEQTVTIGNRNAGQSKGSVFIGELDGYNDGGKNDPVGMKNNYVTAVGFQSNATGWGSIAIGSNAVAENTRETSQVVDYDGNKGTSGTVQDDNYGIKLNPPITWSSVALGYNAHSKDGNIAIGANSDATSTDKGDSYVSVGNGTLKRRITNVAKGTDNSDVVTVGQMNDAIKQADNLNVNAGWGINVADENDPTNTGKETKNDISLKHNLGTGYNDDEAKGMIIGGLVEGRDPAKQYGAADANSVIVGAGKALASGKSSVVVGGLDNVASGATSVVIGGDNNNAAGNQSAVFGGRDNKAVGVASTASGGIMNAAVGQQATAIGGSNNYVLGANATAVGGLGRDYANGEVVYDSAIRGSSSVGIAGGSTGEKAMGALAAGHQSVVTTENGTAIGYQATTDEANTIAFGHDAGDVSGYTIKWKQLPPNQINADGTTNDYTQAPESVTENKYTMAAYNRLVKVADGQDDHDVVVMEQLKQYAEKDASNLGNNIKVYKTDEKGNVQLGKDKQPVEDKDATTTAQKNSKDDWGKALGAGTFTTGKSDAATDASNSEQLVTGKTLYNYDAPVAETGKKLNYVSANNTTGQNLSALDAQVADNASKLNDKTHNIKYYSVNDKKSSTQETLPTVKGLLADNSDNKGAKGMGSLASGFSTEADGIASTVAGSYSGVINTGDVKLMGYDFRGATALSYGTFNINQSTAQSGVFSGVANSIVGQANMTTNSNAAIIYGAGNTVTNSYRLIDPTKAGAILDNVSDPAKLGEALQAAVKDSGGQVMVMGGGNTVDKAYMTQVTGVGNTVTGADSTYAEGTSTQYNFVDGFQNELTNGKNDYIIGSNNSVTGDHIDKNQSNIVVGDNHTLTNRKNNVVIGSADKKENKNKELTASDATVIGHNADVTVDGGVAIGSGSVSKATAEADAEGYDPVSTTTNKASANTSATWKATTGAVSIGGVNGNTTTTRRITNLAAGFNDTDAVNVAQIKKLANIDASNIGTNLKGSDSKTAATTDEQNTNENAWGESIGTGKIADPDASDKKTNGSQQLVTGGTVYKALNGGMTKIVIGTPGENGKDGAPGTIGLVGPAGADGKNAEVDITIQQGKDEESKGVKGANGVDGQDGITRIVYKDAAGDHQVATMEDGLKFAGDDGQKDANKVIAKKLNNIVDIIGGAKGDLTEGNIGVNNDSGKLKVQLVKDLTGITSISGSTDDKGAKITLDTTDKNISVNGGSIKDVATNLDQDGEIISGNENNAANMSDVSKLINNAADSNGKKLADKANVDASNIGTNLNATTDEQNTNENAWGKAIGTGKIADSDASDKETNGSQQLVTGGTVYKALNGGMTKIVIGTPGENGKDGAPGTIGLVGPAGADGKNAEVDITIQQGKDEESKGVKGANGVDGQDGITRIVYKDAAGDHQVATMEDGLKFAGDDGQKDANKVIAKKLNNIVDIIGGAKGDLTEGNIGVNNDSGKLKIQLAQELTGITSISGSTGSNGAKITLDTNDQNISVNGGKITDVASGLSTNDGSYNSKDANNAANISDVNSMISKAVTDAKGETQQNLDKKANVDASNIGTKLKGADGKTAATEDEQKANLDKWGEAIGTGEVKDGSNQLVTGNTVYNAVKDKADKSYVDTQLSTKANTDGSNIDADKFSKKVAIGNINDSDERAVSGKTVNEAIQTINGNIDGKANKNLDNIDNAGKNVVKDQARAAVTIDNKGLNTNVVATQDDKNHTTTYTINVEGNGKVAAKDTGLISGDTIYNELRPATDGTYIKTTNTTAQNLTSLDTQVRATHDLINSDGKTIKIGGSDAATKIDVNGKDGKGRVITGVVSDANDPTSAANVGYVNGVTSANTQQIYRDMNNAYGRLNNNINKAAAGSNALAALHPLDYDPDDKADFAVGYGHYRNANAAAVGAFYHPNENTMVNVGVSLGNGDPGFNAGVSFKVGRGGAGREAMSKTEMAKVINSQSKEIDALKKDNADKDKRIDALEQKMAEILAKLDKNGK